MLSTDAAIRAASDLLGNRLGGQPHLSDPEVLGGSGAALVVRARVATNPFVHERTVIIKQLPPEALNGPDPALIREIVAYQFTNTLANESRPGPVMLAYDIDKRLLVTTDAGSADNLIDVWNTCSDDDKAKLVRSLGTSLGRMHRATAGAEDDFAILLRRMMSRAKIGRELVVARGRVLADAIGYGLTMVRELGVDVSPEVADFATDSARRLASGQHRAFTPFDLSPDNILCGKQRITYLDFEWAGFRDVTFDVACVIAGFPQYAEGSALSGDLSRKFINAWRHEVSEMWPNVLDDERLRARIVTALVGWALLSLAIVEAGGLSALIDNVLVSTRREAQEHESHARHGETSTSTTSCSPIELAWGEQIFEGRSRTHDQLVIRRDIIQTFEALAALADRGNDPRFPAVSAFANDVCSAVRNLERSGT
ncbi:phosphotransferase family protein [Corynebacterium kroppenstedtii]|uniref:phosphotransferase family protein n=1 Tax=Corynebacterium sp. PCR 32 TaxID=3351342 RepID=UPI0030974B3E